MNKRKPVTEEQIDLLRAGLLDDQPELKNRVEAALRDPANNQADDDIWDRLGRELDDDCAHAIRVNNQLRLRRRRVLSGAPGRSPRLRQRSVLTAVASVVLAITVAVFLVPSGDRGGAGPTRIIDSGRDMPDLTDNVDFYVWMEAQPPTRP